MKMEPRKNTRKLSIAGIAFLALALWWTGYASKEIEMLPENFSLEANIVSTDNFYDEFKQNYSGPIYSKTAYSYATVGTDGGAALVVNMFDVKTPDDQPIFSVSRTYAVDRMTRTHVAGKGDKDREGYLFAPSHLKKGQEFTYWHINYDGPARMMYDGNEVIDGLPVYRYKASYDGVKIDQTENLGYLPGVGTTRGVVVEPMLTLWVEPLTGQLVKYADDSIAYFYDLKSGEKIAPWNHFTNTFSEGSVRKMIGTARVNKVRKKIVEWYIPFLLVFVGLALLAIAGGVLAKLKKAGVQRQFVNIGIIVLTGITLLTLFGWISGKTGLAHLIDTHAAMNPLTAVTMLLLTLALVARRARHGAVSSVMALFVLGITLSKSLSHMHFIGLQIDLSIYGEKISAIGMPAMMSGFTTMCFLLLGVAILLYRYEWFIKLRIAEILASVVLLSSLLLLFGYLFDMSEILDLPLFFSASAQTAVCFAVASYIVFSECGSQRVQESFAVWLGTSAILLGCIVVTIALSGLTQRALQDDARNKFSTEVYRAKNALSERLAIYIGALQSAGGLFAASESVESNEWKAYIDALDIHSNYPGIQGMGYAVFIPREKLNTHTQAIRSQGLSEYRVWPEGIRDIYSSIIYLEPLDERNKRAVGFDMYQEPTRRLAMERARDTGLPRMTGKVTLVQETSKDIQSGFLIYVPIYKKGMPHGTTEERRAAIEGIVYSVFRVNDFMNGIYGSDGIPEIGFSVHDGVVREDAALMYSDMKTKLGTLPPSGNSGFALNETLYVAGRPWTLSYAAKPGYGYGGIGTFAHLVVLLAGVMMSILLSMLSHSLLSSRQRAVAIAEDLTKDLREAKAKDEAMLLSIGDGVIGTDRDGNIEIVNDAFERIVGWKREEVIGRKLSEVLPMKTDNDKPVANQDRPIFKALSGKENILPPFQIFYTKKDGTQFAARIAVNPVIIQGEVIGAIEIFRDVTKEWELDKRQKEFISLASHQLKTPVTALRLSTELLLKERFGKLTDEQKKIVEPALSYAVGLAETVHTMLSVTRLEESGIKLEYGEIEVAPLLEEIERAHAFWYKKKNLSFSVDCQAGLKLHTDKNVLKEIVSNFVSNAIRYTPEHGNITVKASVGADEVTVAVADTGIGIPPDAQKNICKKFFRAENARNKVTDGTGLGLYLAQSLVKTLGGRLSFESQQGVETTFAVTLPMNPANHER